MRSYFDVVAVSARFGSLLTAALLAKRGFRVLVVRHDAHAAHYPIGEYRLPRSPFNFTAADTPIARRIFSELAIHQSFRQKSVVHDPAFQVVLPGHRFDLAATPSDLARELDREFPTVARALETFFEQQRSFSESMDQALDQDVAIPALGFFEERALTRAFQHIPKDVLSEPDPLRVLPEEHPFRLVFHAPTRFSDAMDPDHVQGPRARRAFSARCSGGAALVDGADAIRDLLVQSIRAHKGEVFEKDKIDKILVHKRGVAEGVRLASSGDEIGAGHVILGGDVSTILGLLPDRQPFEALFEDIGEPVVRYYRYTLNVRVRAEVVPVGIARDVFFVRDVNAALSGTNCLHIETHGERNGTRLICIEALLPRRQVDETEDLFETLREQLVRAVAELIPFLEEHIVFIDSPHDGRPGNTKDGAAVMPAEPWARGPKTMETVLGYPLTSTHGLAALPTRTPIQNLLLANEQVVPGLGLEGTMIAAWNAARIVGKADAKRDGFRSGVFRWLGR